MELGRNGLKIGFLYGSVDRLPGRIVAYGGWDGRRRRGHKRPPLRRQGRAEWGRFRSVAAAGYSFFTHSRASVRSWAAGENPLAFSLPRSSRMG